MIKLESLDSFPNGSTFTRLLKVSKGYSNFSLYLSLYLHKNEKKGHAKLRAHSHKKINRVFFSFIYSFIGVVVVDDLKAKKKIYGGEGGNRKKNLI